MSAAPRDHSAHAAFLSTRHFASLDGLRALAILLVIAHHALGAHAESVLLVDPGATGVALFFALSGFLITTLLLRERDQTGTINLGHFYARRTLRIFPLYYAVLALYAVAVAITVAGDEAREFWRNLPAFATYTSNWFVDLPRNADGSPKRVIFYFAWSLATEEQFYLVWPWIVRTFRPRWALACLATTMALVFGLKLLYGSLPTPTSTLERIVRIAQSPSLEIGAGVALAMTLHHPAGFRLLRGVLGHRWSAPLAAALAGAIALTHIPEPTIWYALQAMLLTALVGACVIREDHPLAPALRWRPLARIGVVSYGMYLLHIFALNTARAALSRLQVENAVLLFVIASLLTYAAAECSFRLFESRFLRLKSRFARPESRPVPEVVVTPAARLSTPAPTQTRVPSGP